MDKDFGILQNVVARMEKVLDEIRQEVKEISACFALHEKESIKLQQDTNNLMKDVVEIRTTLYDEKAGVLQRVRDAEQKVIKLEEWRTTTTAWIEKVFWEAAKPIIGLLVTGLLIGLAILIVFIYSLQFLVQLLP